VPRVHLARPVAGERQPRVEHELAPEPGADSLQGIDPAVPPSRWRSRPTATARTARPAQPATSRVPVAPLEWWLRSGSMVPMTSRNDITSP
jgi:hypothetical protein